MKDFSVTSVMREVVDPGPELLYRLVDTALARGVQFHFRKEPIGSQGVREVVGERVREGAAKQQGDGVIPFGIRFAITLPSHPDVQTAFSFDISTSGATPYWSNIWIGGLLDFEFKDQRRLIVPFAEAMQELAVALQPIAQPRLGYLDNSWLVDNEAGDIKKLRLKALGWTTWFSPAYVERFGENFLLGLPGYRAERLGDGGVLFQLSPAILSADKQEAQALRERVVAYFAEHGHKVSCRAPYVIPGALDTAPEAQAGAGDPAAEVRELLQTTFVLDDGVRLKTLYLSWDDWTPTQQTAVLAALRETLTAELRTHGGRLRLELNELPLPVEQVLLELWGRDNPDAGWAVVEM